jgi:protein-disulfide isomerase
MDMGNRLKVFALILAFSTMAFTQQKPAAKSKSKSADQLGTHATANLPSEEEVNAFLHETFGYDPQLTWKIAGIRPSQAGGLAEVTVQVSGPQGQGDQKFFVTEDGKHAVVGDVIPFGPHPFERTRELLDKKVTGTARGPASAPVTIVEFSDLQCPHCKEAAPTVERLLAENPNIHFVFQNFPLPMHNWALKGAEYADCVGRTSNDAFWKFISAVYAAQSDITAENADQKLTELAETFGVNSKEVAACAVKPETQARVDASVNLGKSLEVNATPTLFINGRPVGVNGNNYDVLKQIVDFAANDK